jgi:hypothetical protein
MKYLISILCLAGIILLSANKLHAQEKNRFGLKGGFTMYKSIVDFDNYEVNSDSRAGFAAGVFAEFRFNEYVSVQPELLYIQKNSEETDDLFNGSEMIETTFTYIDVPVLLKINVPLERSVSPFIAVGPYIGYLLDAKESQGGETADVKEFLKDINYGLAAGAGFKLRMFSFEIRYDLGLADISDEVSQSDDLEVSYKVKGFAVTVGISF